MGADKRYKQESGKAGMEPIAKELDCTLPMGIACF